MGRDKASLVIDGCTMLERLLLILRNLVAETVVMRAPGQTLPQISQELKIKVLEQSVIKIDLPINIRRVKIESMGLINPFKYMRGDIFIQVI